MPLIYNPETGIPSFRIDPAIELDEGVTPVPDVIDSKSAVFAGDRSPFAHRVRRAKPARLDAYVATDSEIDEIERQARGRTIKQWPLILRLINRLRIAERNRRD